MQTTANIQDKHKPPSLLHIFKRVVLDTPGNRLFQTADQQPVPQ